MTQHEMDKVIAQYRHWIDRPYEPEPQVPGVPSWRLADALGIAVALILAGAGAAVLLA
jgi:hypothetical protein